MSFAYVFFILFDAAVRVEVSFPKGLRGCESGIYGVFELAYACLGKTLSETNFFATPNLTKSDASAHDPDD
jgi:hypothetical protein